MQLGVSKVYLALDGDGAGREAAAKIGALFFHESVDVRIVPIPKGKDPDALLLERGPEHFAHLLEASSDYLTFLYAHLSNEQAELTPSKKNEIVKQITETIKSCKDPVMVHESLKRLSEIAQIPETALGINEIALPELLVRRSEKVAFDQINPDLILEADFLRWLFLAGPHCPQIFKLAQINISLDHFRIPAARKLYDALLKNSSVDFLSLASTLESEEEQQLLSDIMQRKINMQKAEEGCKETIRKMLLRSWMEQREAIRIKIHSTFLTDEEALELAKQFDALKSRIPEVIHP
jgi:DNA primase